jgi:hypothetical protein
LCPFGADDKSRGHEQACEHRLGHFATPRRNDFQAIELSSCNTEYSTISLPLSLRSSPRSLFFRVLHPGHFGVREAVEMLENAAALQPKVASRGNDTVLNRR